MASWNLQNSRTRRIVFSYGKDWLLVLIMTIVFFAIDIIPPFHREFSLDDKELMHSFTENETIPAWTLVLICLAGPVAFIFFIANYYQKSMRDFHSGVLGLFLALSMTIMLTDIIKITAGRPRPDFLARCQAPLDAMDPPRGLSNYTVCTTPVNSYIMRDGFKSFPSGHSSFSFAGLGYTGFYLAGKMHIFDERGHTYKCFLFAFPVIAALLVAISRTRDYRHHWQDVCIGTLLGIGCAYFSYRQYYPSLIHSECEVPYGARFGSVDLLPNDDGLNEEERPMLYGDGTPAAGDEETSLDGQHTIVTEDPSRPRKQVTRLGFQDAGSSSNNTLSSSSCRF